MTGNGRLATLCAVMLLTVTLPLRAVKEVEMPENFGSSQWAVAHWSEAVDYLEYIAGEEMSSELAALPGTERPDAWQKFWNAHDPTMGNELSVKYFQRISYANEHFGSILLPGWKTEMGETWIRLGAPDWRDRQAMRGPGRDMEIWNYMGSRDVYLVFIDRTGVGDYDLLNYSAMLDEVYFYN